MIIDLDAAHPRCWTGDTLARVDHVSICDFRRHTRELVERAHAGEQIVITRYGKLTAVLRPITRNEASARPGAHPRGSGSDAE